ncbi:asparagine synthase (glutamine-hydrolyzing) [bacterium]|nr:asparagine synthase (glutamine-hydrolyzing) [bacterium]
MCGITGIYFFDREKRVELEPILRMNQTIFHRGPDDDGFFIRNNVALAMRRLSIIDVAGGKQPIQNEDETVTIVFNGEIYNFQKLRQELQAKGHFFKTKSDTEVILRGFLEYGDEVFNKLNGMFGLALYESQTNTLTLARDRIGEKPLYYYADSEKIVFGSEIKSILAFGESVRNSLDKKALYDYLTYLYVPAPKTIFSNIKKLKQGHFLKITEQGIRETPFWKLTYNPIKNLSLEDAKAKFSELLEDSVKIRMISEVPLGAFLSGGIDSGTVAALMQKISSETVNTFSIGFPVETEFNELPDSISVAKKIGTNHHTLVVKPDSVSLLEKIIYHLDEPMADSSVIPTFLLSEFTRKKVTVALSGDGGDELFAGYLRHKLVKGAILYNKIPIFLRKVVLGNLLKMFEVREQTPGKFESLKRVWKDFDGGSEFTFLRWITNFNQDFLKEVCTEELLSDFEKYQFHEVAKFWLGGGFSGKGELNRVLNFETFVYQPDDLLMKVDKMSMANSLEVRVPFLDYRLVEFAALLPENFKLKGFESKFLLKEFSKKLLPEQVVRKKKQGFVPPLREWFRNELKDFTKDNLLSKNAFTRQFFKMEAIEKMLGKHEKCEKNYEYQIFVILSLELWGRRFGKNI